MEKIIKTEAEWKKVLTPDQYKILREHKTEGAFSGPYWENKETGQYLCAGCGEVLFGSDSKFDSGTGWPSFDKPMTEGVVETSADNTFFMKRTEVHCAKCNGHLGHVFSDGPKATTGLRYCINSHALKFKADEK